MSGLAPDRLTYRDTQPDTASPDPSTNRDHPFTDSFGAGATIIETDDDGGVTIRTPHVSREDAGSDFDRNLARDMSDGDLAAIAADIMEGIEADRQSRSDFMTTYAKGLDLLGLKVDEGAGDDVSVSRVSHPLLLEAVVKSQGAARSELLPASGPCKVSVRGDSDATTDDLARALEDDMNAYLTTGAREYYADLDRGLFGLFFSGNLFRKVYFHPLRKRPVCESVGVEDLIVSEDAVDLDTALRITHRSELSQPMMRRMQLYGDWLDIGLPAPQVDFLDPAHRKQRELQGLSTSGVLRQQDQPYQVYECTTDIDLGDYGITGLPEMPVPVVVTLEAGSRQVLAVRRGWRQGDEQFRRRQRFVHYGMVPALNFLCLGHLHLLGNHTRALRAAWRLILDAGMFSNFPGGVKLKGVKMANNNIRPKPGEFPDIDANGIDDIKKVIMPMPYKEASAVFIQFIEGVSSQAKGLAATIDVEMGEGRTNIPVGSMMAMIEQASQLSAVIHKRLHTAQAREFELLKEVIAENPEAITAVIPNPQKRWVGQLAFNNVDLLPASDPNVPSQIHRVMLATALVTMAGQNPDIYDKLATHQRAWRAIGVGDADSFLHAQAPAGGGAAPPPDPAQMIQAQAAMMKAQADAQGVQIKQQEQQRKAATETVEAGRQAQRTQQESQDAAAERGIKLAIAHASFQTEQLRQQTEAVRAKAQQDTAEAKVEATRAQAKATKARASQARKGGSK